MLWKWLTGKATSRKEVKTELPWLPTSEKLEELADFAHEVALDLKGEDRAKMCGIACALRRSIKEREKSERLVAVADKLRDSCREYDNCFISLCEVCAKKCDHGKDSLAFDLADRIRKYDEERGRFANFPS